MAPARLWLSVARAQGLARVRQRLGPSSVSSTAMEALRVQEYSTAGSHSRGVIPPSFPPRSGVGHHRLQSRSFAAAPVKQDEINEIIEEINSKFADAREEIELASESKETVYFNEESEVAKKAVNEVLGLFNGLLARLPESERGALQRSMGLKMEQLKAEVAQLDE